MMWISDYVTRNSIRGDDPSLGEITAGSAEEATVSSSASYFNLSTVAPYGIAYVPVVGARTVVLPASGGGVVLGVLADSSILPEDASSLEAGELMLYSRGGASIVLKNNGSVLINGNEVG